MMKALMSCIFMVEDKIGIVLSVALAVEPRS